MGAIAVSVIVHALFMIGVMVVFDDMAERIHNAVVRAAAVVAIVLWFFVSICVQCWLWAWLLMVCAGIPTLEEALYFTTVTFTTLGYGDVVLDDDWRLLGAFAATNGVIIIGWTTAVVFLAVQKLYIVPHARAVEGRQAARRAKQQTGAMPPAAGSH